MGVRSGLVIAGMLASSVEAFAQAPAPSATPAQRRAELERECAGGMDMACTDRILADLPAPGRPGWKPTKVEQATITKIYKKLEQSCRIGDHMACVRVIEALLEGTP